MGMTANLDTFLWEDPELDKLTTTEILLYVWALHNSRSSPGGIFRLNPGVIKSETRIDQKYLTGAIRNLESLSLVRFDLEKGVVWAQDYITRYVVSPKVAIAAARAAMKIRHPFSDGLLVWNRACFERFGILEQVKAECLEYNLNFDKLKLPSNEREGQQKISTSRNKVMLPHIQEVFAYWQEQFNRPGTLLTPQRKAICETRLKTFTVQQLKDAILSYSQDPWRHGVDDRAAAMTRHEFITLLKSDDKVLRQIEKLKPQGKEEGLEWMST